MWFCFIIRCHLYLLSRLPFSRVIHSERIFIPLRYFPLYFKVNALQMYLNLNAALSSFIAASPRLIHHSKTRTEKKKKKKKNLFHWPVSRPKHYLCEPSISCSSSADRLVYGPTNTWMGHICFYLFLLCATSSPPFVTSVAPSSVLRWRRLCFRVTWSFRNHSLMNGKFKRKPFIWNRNLL